MKSERSRGTRFKRVLTQGLPLSILSLAMSVLALELFLRLIGNESGYYPYYPNTQSIMYPSEAITPGISGPSSFTTNSLGTRGPEYANEPYSIITVGGSTTACSALDDSEEWPHLLMEYLNEDAPAGERVWVTNSGMDGKNSHHHIMHAKYLFPRISHLDLAIFYVGMNDVGRWLYKKSFDPDYIKSEENWQRELASSFRNLRTDTDPWYKHLELYNRLSVIKANIATARNETRNEEGHIIQDNEFAWLENERNRRANAQKRFIHQAKRETLPIALEEYKENLIMMIELSRENGIEPVFIAQTIAIFYGRSDEKDFWMGAMDGGSAYIKTKEFGEVLVEYNKCMEEVALDHGVPFLDLPNALQDPSGDFFFDSCHFNEHGAREMARVVGEFLADNVLAPKT